MITYIALFRGINIGGRHIIPMSELKIIIENLDLKDVKTYIQSGNVVFKCNEKNRDKLSAKISLAIDKKFGFEPKVMLLSIGELEEAIKLNPFKKGESDHKTLHVMFLSEIPSNPNMQAMETIKVKGEQFRLIEKLFYLYAPDGVGRSKLAANIEKHLGVPITGRNWRTVQEVYSIAKEYK